MEFLGYLFLFIIVFIIGKFAYDSYLTNNTEKRWEEFKHSDPKTASEIENSNFGRKKGKRFKFSSDLELEKSEYEKENDITVDTAIGILKNRVLLNESRVYEGVGVENVTLNNNKTHSYAIVYLNAMNTYGKTKALEYFGKEEYQQACNTNESIVVTYQIGKSINKLGIANITVQSKEWLSYEGEYINVHKVIKVEPCYDLINETFDRNNLT